MEDSLILLLITKKQINMYDLITWLREINNMTYKFYKETNKKYPFSKEQLTEYEYQNLLLYLYRKGTIII